MARIDSGIESVLFKLIDLLDSTHSIGAYRSTKRDCFPPFWQSTKNRDQG